MKGLAYVIGLGALVSVIALASMNRPAPGKGATDVLPPKWTGKPPFQDDVQGKSGRKYKVSGWPPVGDEDYFVAEKDGDPNVWIAWIHNRKTDARKYFRAAANSKAERDQMASDFGIVGVPK